MRELVIDEHSLKRFQGKYQENVMGCWKWIGYIKPNGYGQFAQSGRGVVYAHRWSYKAFKGEPGELDIDHLCRNRDCVNPEHLEAVDRKTNLNRGVSWPRSKTHCPQGHEYNEANTYLINNSSGQHRMCRKCRYERNKVASKKRRLQNV